MPHTPRQYLRALLLKFGIGSEAAFRLNLNEIRSDDVFLCSYPKSGNTWLRFILAHLYSTRSDITPRNVDELVPDVYMANEKANAAASPRLLKTHHPLFADYPKAIYVLRDVRDVMLSYYHYQKALGVYNGSFGEFIDVADTLHPFGSWSAHVEKAIAFEAAHPERLLLLRYEDLQQNPEAEIQKLVAFLNIPTQRSIAEAVVLSSFERLSTLEATHGSTFSDKSGKPFFRSGKTGEGKTQLSAEDHARLFARHTKAMQLLHYS
jgi:estrone sulfotransferase